MLRHPAAPEPAADPPVIAVEGWVVVVYGENGKPRMLTNSDLMDKAAAEHEAATWRARARTDGSVRRYEVRPVMGRAER